ncbi:MAG: hypothetical protein ACTHJN_19285 [Ginsengibacter sp.]
MADLSNKTATIYINHAAADEALKKLQAQADKLTESIKKGQDAGKDMVTQLNKLNDVKNQMASVQRQIDQGLKPSFNQLQALVAKTTAELKKMSESDPGFLQKTKDLNKYSTELSRLGNKIGTVSSVSGGLKSAFKEMLAPLAELATGAAIIGFLKDSVDEAIQSDKAVGKLKGTLDNLGKTDVFDRLSSKAEDMADRFKFLDKTDIVNVFDRLITYGKLTENQIDQLTPVIINYSVKSRVSIDEATTTILQALEGQGRALKEYGINLSGTKSEAERLGIIMDTLAAKVNGAADAFGGTTQGAIAEVTQRVKSLKEELGTGLLPTIKYTLIGLNEFLSKIGTFLSFVKNPINLSGDIAANNLEALGKAQQKYADEIVSGIGNDVKTIQEKIDEQKKFVADYKSILQQSRDLYNYYVRTGQEDRAKEQADVVGQNNAIYETAQRNLNNTLEIQAKIAEEKRQEAAKKAEQERQKELKKAQENFKKLQQMWEELQARINNTPLGLTNDPEYQAFKKVNEQAVKDTTLLKTLLDKRVIDYQQYSDEIVKIEKLRHQQISDIAAKYRNANTDIAYTPSLVPPLNTTAPISTTLPNQKDITAGQNKLAADEEDRQKKLEAEKNFQRQKAELILSSASDLLNQLDSIQAQHDQAKLDANQAAYDADKNLLDRQLAQKVLSQKEYNREIAKLDEKKRKEDAVIKKKEFETQKEERIAQTIMSGAQAVVSALKDGPLAPLEIALISATTAVELALIASQKAPQYAKGGLIDGPSHQQGGMAVVKNGQKVAEIEGGEPILSRATYKNNKEIVNQLLYSSMYGNGAPIIPYWQSRDYRPVNYSALNRSIETVRHFASGGILPGGGVTSSSGDLPPAFFDVFNNMQTTIVRLDSTVTNLEKRVSEPFRSYVLITDVNAQNDILDRIKSETTIK